MRRKEWGVVQGGKKDVMCLYAQRIGPQLKFIKMTLLERTGVGRLLQIDCDDIYSKIGF